MRLNGYKSEPGKLSAAAEVTPFAMTTTTMTTATICAQRGTRAKNASGLGRGAGRLRAQGVQSLRARGGGQARRFFRRQTRKFTRNAFFCRFVLRRVAFAAQQLFDARIQFVVLRACLVPVIHHPSSRGDSPNSCRS